MLHPLTWLAFKLAIFDQAEHNLATREAALFACLQEQLLRTWQAAWGSHLTFHDVQLPSFNMSEYWWIYLDALGEMRLSQAETKAQNPEMVSTTVTIDLADLHSPYGSVHNQQKQEVGRRVALNVLRTGYGQRLNVGPNLKGLQHSSNNGSSIVVQVATDTAADAGAGVLAGTHDCTKCCAESAFETSPDGVAWSRTIPPAQPKPGAGGVAGSVEILLESTGLVKWVRYGYDALVQCVYLDGDGLPLGPFKVVV